VSVLEELERVVSLDGVELVLVLELVSELGFVVLLLELGVVELELVELGVVDDELVVVVELDELGVVDMSVLWLLLRVVLLQPDAAKHSAVAASVAALITFNFCRLIIFFSQGFIFYFYARPIAKGCT
jgi:hypothetical protein